MTLTARLAWGIALAVVETCAAEPGDAGMASDGPVRYRHPGAPRKYSSHPPDPPIIVDLVVSQDGKHLAAAYHVRAEDVARAEWDAWVVVWDLATGRHLIIDNGTAPLAISPDGQWLVTVEYTRSGEHGDRYRPRGMPVLWRLGEVAPLRTLESDMQPGELVAAAFQPDSAEVIGITVDGRLLAWTLSEEAPARAIGDLSCAEMEKPQLAVAAEDWRAQLIAQGGRLTILAPVEVSGKWRQDRRHGITAQWARTGTKSPWSRTSCSLVKPDAGDSLVGSVLGILERDGRPFSIRLPFDLEESYTRPGMLYWYMSGRGQLAFAPHQRLVAFMDTDAALAVVRKSRGDTLMRFPAHQVLGFTPDGGQVIVSGRWGELRFLDVASGKIVRSLRPDGIPVDTFRAAAIQTSTEFGRPEDNRKRLEYRIGLAAWHGTQIVVLPETAVTGYMSPDLSSTWRVGDRAVSEGLTGVDPRDVAETVPGPSTVFFAKLARDHVLYLTVPLVETDRRTGEYFNTVVLLGPDGNILAHYRKLNPWPWAERGWATEGNLGHPVVDTPFGRLGMLVCYDIHQQSAEMARLKIDTLLYSVAWVDEKDSDWFPRQLPEIARSGGYNIVAANWTLPHPAGTPSWHGYGQSCVIDASGQTLAKAESDTREGIVFADLPLPADR